MTAAAQMFKMTRWVAGLVMMLAFAVIGQAQERGLQAPGDFQVGDKIQLTIEGPVHFDSTVVVRDGLYFVLPNAINISVKGVARANAQEYLTTAVAKYMKGATVRATVLIRVGVFGFVLRPGYSDIPLDMLLSDVPTQAAGGFGPTADRNKIVVKRENRVVVGQEETQRALATSKTVGDLGLRSNDVFEIGDKPQRSFTQYLQVAGVVLGIVGVILTLKTQLH